MLSGEKKSLEFFPERGKISLGGCGFVKARRKGTLHTEL